MVAFAKQGQLGFGLLHRYNQWLLTTVSLIPFHEYHLVVAHNSKLLVKVLHTQKNMLNMW